MGYRLVTLGLADRPWLDDRPKPQIRGVADTFDARSFTPGSWHADLPYVPFKASDRFDQYWGAKLVTQFSREQIHAAVEAGRYSDPRAVEYLTDTLVKRQHATGVYWFSKVAPLEQFTFTPDLCWDDIAIERGYAMPSVTHYTITPVDLRGHWLAKPMVIDAGPDGRTCVAPPAMSRDRDGYTVVMIESNRPGLHATTMVHVALDPTAGIPRVIGLWRM
jgi:hypothetical protein